MTDLLAAATTVIRIGKTRTQHAWRVLIEDGRVIVRTRCGLDPGTDRTLLQGFTTCDDCFTSEETTP